MDFVFASKIRGGFDNFFLLFPDSTVLAVMNVRVGNFERTEVAARVSWVWFSLGVILLRHLSLIWVS